MIRDTPEWALCLDLSVDRKARRTAADTLVSRATPEDVADLLVLSQEATDRELVLIISTLGQLQEDEALAESDVALLSMAMKKVASRTELVSAEWTLAHGVLDNIAGDFRSWLGEDLAARGLTIEAFDADLEESFEERRAAALPKARDIEVKDALDALFTLMPTHLTHLHSLRSDVNEWVTLWRASGDAQAFYTLYGRFIGSLPLQAIPLQALVDVLGTPTNGDRHTVHYGISSGSGLVLVFDKAGLLEGMHMS